MTKLKSRLDPKTTALLVKAARSQVQIGLGDIVIDRGKVKRKQKELILNGRNKKQVIQYRSLSSHQKGICECQNCPLGATRTKFVYGVGNPKADVLFIGEAPGRDEDLRGEPFVGRAGQLLDKILEAINFKREDVYIANILKCRPPNNRDPQPDEMQTCMPYLLEQIKLIKPKIICALGRISAQGLLQTTTPLGKLRGQWHDFNGIPFIVTYHPAALLRFPSYKRDTWEDVKRLREKFDELAAE
ncbi:MAG: uracil-DNA glycosylase [candidate division Zixibacteria bacterium HGW-Zixibacteria-1]|nr:MAG: uracil-DNA glycosylase [candidate division Zixibacteria bacterium HGW-Zixibacteria-1]